MSEKIRKNGHDRNYAVRVLAYTLYAGFNGVETIIVAYLSFYLTNSLFLSAAIVGVLIAVAKLFDGVSDIIAGFLIDHTHTRWGKARPYSLFVIPMWITVILLFSTPASWSDGAKCAYVFVMYILTDTVFRTLILAADPVHYRHGFNKKEQVDSVAIWGTAGGVIGIGASIVIPMLVNTYQFVDHGWTIITVILAIPSVLLCSLKFFFVPETQEVEDREEGRQTKVSVKDSVKYLLRNKYIFIFAVVLLVVFVLMSMSSLQTYYFTYIIGDMSKMAVANTFSMASLFVTPFYPMLAKKFGKRNTAVTCFIIGGVISLVAVFFSKDYVVLGIVNTIRVMAYGCVNVMPALYTIECMKYTEWQDGVQLEGIVASVVSLAQKIGGALSLLLTGVVMEAFGYDGNLAVQPESATNAIWWMYIVFPALLMFICAGLMYFYKVEKQMPQIEKELAERAGRKENI